MSETSAQSAGCTAELRRFRKGWLGGLAVIAGLLCWHLTGPQPALSAADPAAAADQQPQAALPVQNRSDFMGAQACIECHRSEYVAWLGSVHYDNGGINRLDTSNDSSVAAKYQAAHGSLKVCLDCHAAPAELNFGRLQVESGTSCESCHGASGGAHGWLNRHAVYGPNVTRMHQETPQHLAARQAYCDNAGMVRAGRVYELAKNCYRCHIVGDQQLVTEDVGHSPGHELFELIPWMQGEVRHNFHMNQRHNAELPSLLQARGDQSLLQRQRLLFIAGQLAVIEVCLRNLAAVEAEEDLEEAFADAWKDRVDDAKDLVEEIVELLEEPDESLDVEPLEDEDLQAVVDAVDELGRRFRDLTRANAASTADLVQTHAENFFDRHDGSRLAALDEDFLLDPPAPKGTALEP